MITFLFLISLVRAASLDRLTVSLSLPLIDSRPFTLAFGSCYRILDFTNDIFSVIGREHRPDLWAWLGDAAYTDNIPKAQWVTDNSMDLEYI